MWNSKRYANKKFSILGDSISTLWGYNPIGYQVFYQEENCINNNVREMIDTWWGKVIDFFGGELLVNNSWSGSRVTKLPDSETVFPSGCSMERTGGLHFDENKPDVIIVYLGTNDWAYGVWSEMDIVHSIENDNLCVFDFAYDKMLKELKHNYPDAEIWCCTIPTTFISSNPTFQFPYDFGGTHIEVYNYIIKNSVKENGCRLIDLYGYRLPYDTLDGSHPTDNGMRTLATMVVKAMGD